MAATPPSRPRRPLLQEYAEVLVISVLLALFVRTFLVQAFEIPSGSMQPTLRAGDHVLVNKMIFAPTATALERWLLPMRAVEPGDVVVFRSPRTAKQDLVKRCVARAGDRVAVIDKTLELNDRSIAEPYALHLDPNVYPASRYLHESLRTRDNFGPYTVPAGQLFCLGDNRDFSHDSRFWGTVAERNVRGRALLVYWSDDPRAVNPDTAEALDASSGQESDSLSGKPEAAASRPVPRLVR